MARYKTRDCNRYLVLKKTDIDDVFVQTSFLEVTGDKLEAIQFMNDQPTAEDGSVRYCVKDMQTYRIIAKK